MSDEPLENRSTESVWVGSADLSVLDDVALLRLPSLAIGEARRRGLMATWDLPVGGFAERLAGIVYRAEPLGARGVGHDLMAADGRRIEVTAVARGKQMSPAHPEGFDDVVCRLHPESSMPNEPCRSGSLAIAHSGARR